MNQRNDQKPGQKPKRFARQGRALLSGLSLLLVATAASAAPRTEAGLTPVLADKTSLEMIGAEILSVEPLTNVGFAKLDDRQKARLSELNHQAGKCGGFEALDHAGAGFNDLLLTHVFGQLAEQEMKNRRFRPTVELLSGIAARPEITAAVEQVSEANLKQTVEFLSNFPDRDHKGSNPNAAIEAMKARLDQMMNGAKVPYQIDIIQHRFRQSSLRVRIPGAQRPNEIIVMGGHIDSINQDMWGGGGGAPGADDNASGSANIVEALRIISRQAQPERTIEFFWYAGEEGGLLGSAEIARDYKAQSKDVIAVLQLDMTLFPGAGELTIASMTDFTSAWLRAYLEQLNTAYVKAKIVEDKCGYGCSDHASWHRQGYPALMPFEATFRTMNRNLHTSRDRIDERSSFRHSAVFSKIAVAMALELGNSTARSP